MRTEAGRPHILIAGGGYVGMYTALTLQRKLRRGEARVTVVDLRSYMTYQPFLPEAAAGSLEPRHVVVPLRRVLDRRKVDVVTGRVAGIDHGRKVAHVIPQMGHRREVPYDVLVVALGSIARTLPIPGLAECGIGFKRIEEAIRLRNQVIEQLDIAVSTDDEQVRRKALTFVVVGGGYAGVEALAELEDMARDATKYYEGISPGDMRWVLVEATGRILPEVGEDLGRYTLERLRERGIDVRLDTRLESAVGNRIVLSDGTEFDASTLVWTAGVKANPVLAGTDLPMDEKGRVKATATLQIEGCPDAWTAGDNARVPDLTGAQGEFTAPNAQHAVRQARQLGRNIVRVLRGQEPKEYRHKYVGSVASLGLHKGAAQVYGIKLRGWPAWFMHRTYHLSRVPTFNRKVRVVADWTLALFFRREVVALGSLHEPREEFQEAAAPAGSRAPAEGEGVHAGDAKES
jgi:NADH:ubiquinone reductase (H+-translocating)